MNLLNFNIDTKYSKSRNVIHTLLTRRKSKMYFKAKLILFLKTDMDENGLNRKKGA